MSLTADATLPPFPYTASFTANWQTQPIQHLVVKLSLSPGSYQISVLPDLMALTTAVGAATFDDVTEFLPEVLISSATVVRTVNWWDYSGQFHSDENQIVSLLSSPDTLATQAMQDAGIAANYGAFYYQTATVTIEPERTITYSGGAKDVYTADYYLSIDGWNVSYPQIPSGTDVPTSGRFLITVGNPTGQRSLAWGGDWLNVQSWYEFYQPPIVPPVTPPAVDLDPKNLPATISFANTADAHGVETPPIANAVDAAWWHDFGENVLLGYSSQALSALRQLADAAGHYSVGAALDVVNAATTAIGVRDFLNGLVAKIWAHDAEGIQLILNANTTSAQMYEWGAQGNQISQEAQQSARDQAISIPLDQVVPGGGTVYSVYTSMPQMARQENSFSLGLLVPGLQINGSDKSDVVSGGAGADVMQLGAGNDAAMGYAGNDVISAGDGRDWLCGGTGNDQLDGGAGIDSAAYYSSRANYAVSRTGSAWVVNDVVGSDGTDTLTNIERLQFSDKKLALDLNPAEPTGQALEFIGVLAPNLISDPAVVGVILGLFDQGSSLHDVSQLALNIGLVNSIAGSNTNAALAAMAFRNVIGSEADAATVDMLVGFMDGRTASFSQADFLTVIAGLEVNQTHIGLVGLQQTGIEYI